MKMTQISLNNIKHSLILHLHPNSSSRSFKASSFSALKTRLKNKKLSYVVSHTDISWQILCITSWILVCCLVWHSFIAWSVTDFIPFSSYEQDILFEYSSIFFLNEKWVSLVPFSFDALHTQYTFTVSCMVMIMIIHSCLDWSTFGLKKRVTTLSCKDTIFFFFFCFIKCLDDSGGASVNHHHQTRRVIPFRSFWTTKQFMRQTLFLKRFKLHWMKGKGSKCCHQVWSFAVT